MLAFLAMPIKFIEIGNGIIKLKPKEPVQRLEKYIYVQYTQNMNVVLTWPNCNASYLKSDSFLFFKSNLIMLTLRKFFIFI